MSLYINKLALMCWPNRVKLAALHLALIHEGDLMTKQTNRFISIAASLALLAQSGAVFAGTPPPIVGNLTYTSGQVAVPTLSGWTLILLGFLVAVIAFRVMRTRNIGRPAASIVAAGVIALGTASGAKVIQDAHAGATVVPLQLNTNNVSFGASDSVFPNDTPVNQRIVSVVITNNNYEFSDPGNTPCTTLPTLAPGERCYLNLVLKPAPP